MDEFDADDAPRPPRRRRKQARPGEIIEAGLQEFAERGFAGAKLEDVAKRAGIVKGTIYRYFESKEALFEAALKSKVTPIFENIDHMIDVFHGSSADLLQILFRKVYQELFTSDLHILIRIIISEGGRFPTIAETYHRESISNGRRLMEKILTRGIARGEFRKGPVADLPMVVMAPAVMAIVWKMTFEPFEPIAIEKFFAAHVDLVLNGLRANRPSDEAK